MSIDETPSRARLLNELGALRDMLDEQAEPFALPERFAGLDPQSIPLLQDVVEAPQPPALPSPTPPDPAALQAQLREAAPALLAEVMAEFAPRIEQALQDRLSAELERLLQRHGN